MSVNTQTVHGSSVLRLSQHYRLRVLCDVTPLSLVDRYAYLLHYRSTILSPVLHAGEGGRGVKLSFVQQWCKWIGFICCSPWKVLQNVVWNKALIKEFFFSTCDTYRTCFGLHDEWDWRSHIKNSSTVVLRFSSERTISSVLCVSAAQFRDVTTFLRYDA